MLLAEAVEGAVGGDQPAVHRPIRLSEAASNFSLWLFGPFLPYLIAEYYYILLTIDSHSSSCLSCYSDAVLQSFDLLHGGQRDNNNARYLCRSCEGQISLL